MIYIGVEDFTRLMIDDDIVNYVCITSHSIGTSASVGNDSIAWSKSIASCLSIKGHIIHYLSTCAMRNLVEFLNR